MVSQKAIAILALCCVAFVSSPVGVEYFAEPQHRISNPEYWTVYQWRAYVERHLPTFPNLDLPLVLSVIYKESGGIPTAVDGTGLANSAGLMQVVPQTWIPCYEKLTSSNAPWEYDCQIYAGMWMLSNIIKKADGDVRYALAAYNCGFVSVDAGKCYPWGGYTYADEILDNIYHNFEVER